MKPWEKRVYDYCLNLYPDLSIFIDKRMEQDQWEIHSSRIEVWEEIDHMMDSIVFSFKQPLSSHVFLIHSSAYYWKWRYSTYYNEDDPSSGYVYIILDIDCNKNIRNFVKNLPK